MSKLNYINQILKAYPILDYLEKRDMRPVRQYSNRYQFHCPVHEGDHDPSFFVFDDGDHQTCKCFGCDFGGDLLNLVSQVEGISIGAAIRNLAKGLDISEERILTEIADYVMQKDEDGAQFSLEELALGLSMRLRMYLEAVEFDPVEAELVDQAFRKIDPIIRAMDRNALDKLFEQISDPLEARQAWYERKKEAGVMTAHADQRYS